MGDLTLIGLVQASQAELGLPISAAVMGAADNTSRQFGALATRVGRLLMRMHTWTFQIWEWTITVPPPITDTGTLTAGGNTISGLQPSTLAAVSWKFLVSGYGLMTSTRVTAVDVGGGTVTIDQPASVDGAQPLTFNQDSFLLPADWERPLNRTQWDRSMRWELRGPMSPQADQWVRSGIVATGPRRQFRQVNGHWRIWPVPYSGASSGAGQGGGVLHTEYLSSWWVQGADLTWKPRFTADQDTYSFPDDVMVEGLKYLFFRTKGFDTSALEAEFLRVVEYEIGQDGPSPTLDMSRLAWPVLITAANVPDSGFGN